MNDNTTDEKTISPAGVASIRKYWSEALSREESPRLNAAVISYVERLVLVSGGTLTLTFTVVVNLGNHLTALKQNAAHPRYIAIGCWLLVGSIISGLLCILHTIQAQRIQAVQASFLRADMTLRLEVLERGMSIPEEMKLPSQVLDFPKEREEYARWLLAATQVLLVLAFVFLTLFIQANLSLFLKPLPN